MGGFIGIPGGGAFGLYGMGCCIVCVPLCGIVLGFEDCIACGWFGGTVGLKTVGGCNSCGGDLEGWML